jgi:hypothetical protein
MNNFSLTHYFSNHSSLVIPKVGKLEVLADKPFYDMSQQKFEGPRFEARFQQDLYAEHDKSWDILNDYIKDTYPQQAKLNLLEQLNKEGHLHIEGIGTIVKMPINGYDFIPLNTKHSTLHPIDAPIHLQEPSVMQIAVGNDSYTNLEMQEMLNGPRNKRSLLWLWLILGVLAIGGGVWLAIFKNWISF